LNQRRLAVVLAIAWVGAVILAIHVTRQVWKKPPLAKFKLAAKWVAFKCTDGECGYTFRISSADTGLLEDTIGLTASSPMLRCPKCGRHAVRIASYCPRCKEWFVPEVLINPEAPSSIRCPKCGTMRSHSPPAETLPRHTLKSGGS